METKSAAVALKDIKNDPEVATRLKISNPTLYSGTGILEENYAF